MTLAGPPVHALPSSDTIHTMPGNGRRAFGSQRRIDSVGRSGRPETMSRRSRVWVERSVGEVGWGTRTRSSTDAAP
jgi:hypothetical protein